MPIRKSRLTDLRDTALIVLCAGKSSRFGAPKGLIEAAGEGLLERHLRCYCEAGGKLAVVVLGHDVGQYLSTLTKHAAVAGINEDPERGPFSSLQVGLQLLAKKPGWSKVFVTPVDVWAPEASLWLELNRALDGPVKAVKPRHQRQGGHPVLLDQALAGSLLALDSRTNRLDYLLHALPEGQVTYVDVQNRAILSNLNSPQDLRDWSDVF